MLGLSLVCGQRALLMPLWRLRAHMAFLIDNLQYYLQADVLEVQWEALMATAKACDGFEELVAKTKQIELERKREASLRTRAENMEKHLFERDEQLKAAKLKIKELEEIKLTS